MSFLNDWRDGDQKNGTIIDSHTYKIKYVATKIVMRRGLLHLDTYWVTWMICWPDMIIRQVISSLMTYLIVPTVFLKLLL